jgi:hypothetical protein
VLFDQPALCGHPRRCAGRSVSFHDTVLPTLVPPPRPPPSKEDGGTLERGTVTYSAPTGDKAVT